MYTGMHARKLSKTQAAARAQSTRCLSCFCTSIHSLLELLSVISVRDTMLRLAEQTLTESFSSIAV
jgi:hypothetical protein